MRAGQRSDLVYMSSVVSSVHSPLALARVNPALPRHYNKCRHAPAVTGVIARCAHIARSFVVPTFFRSVVSVPTCPRRPANATPTLRSCVSWFLRGHRAPYECWTQASRLLILGETRHAVSMRVLQLHFLQPLVSYRWLALIIEETMALARAPGPPRDYQHPEQPRA